MGLEKRAAEDDGEPVGLMLEKLDARQLIPFTAAHTPHDFWIISEPSPNVQWLSCRSPSLRNLHSIAFAVLKGQTITNNNPLALFEITDYPDPPGGICHPCGSHKQSWSHAGHTSRHTHFDKSAYQKSLNHVPQWHFIPSPLDSVSKKEERL